MKLIDKGELAREKGQNEKALSVLDKAVFVASQKKNYPSLLQALAHKLLVWKHLYLKTKDPAFLELMKSDAEAGLAIAKEKKVSKEFQAVFLLRIGHYYQYVSKYKEAVKFTKQAVNLIDEKKSGKYAEYLGHNGLSLTLSGQKQGLAILRKSLEIIKKAKNLRPFHKLVIHTGILMRLAISLNKFNKKSEAKDMLASAEKLAMILAKKYKMPFRLFQLNEIKKNKLIVF
ncbi:MAG: hypothetical protein HY336_00985 [Candidatus Doudnabacteria bacterium]|nr:hypothetical protein [Candidatus Doudnabacteria bacterium]